jgi:hypothetical protein
VRPRADHGGEVITGFVNDQGDHQMTRKHRTRTALAAVAAAAVAVTGLAGTAEAAPKNKVTIQAEAGGFHGYVKSKKAFCVADRTVKVYNAATGQAILSDTTSEDGSWDTGNPGIRTGSYFAKVKASPGCKAATSKTVQAQP